MEQLILRAVQKLYIFQVFFLFQSIKRRIIAMLAYKQKIFREKPYTQCFQCIQSTRLKCKKCMNQLINDMVEHRHKTQQTQANHKSIIHNRNLSRVHHKRQNQTLEVSSSYAVWMDRVRSHRKDQSDPNKSNFSYWPRKKINNHQKNIKLDVPRFQSWEKRLLSGFAGANQPLVTEKTAYGQIMR